MGFRVVPVGAVPTATIFASGRIATPSNWSVALEKASDTSPSPLKVECAFRHRATGPRSGQYRRGRRIPRDDDPAVEVDRQSHMDSLRPPRGRRSPSRPRTSNPGLRPRCSGLRSGQRSERCSGQHVDRLTRVVDHPVARRLCYVSRVTLALRSAARASDPGPGLAGRPPAARRAIGTQPGVKPRDRVAPDLGPVPGTGAGRGPAACQAAGIGACRGPRVSPGAGLRRPFRPPRIGPHCVCNPSVKRSKFKAIWALPPGFSMIQDRRAARASARFSQVVEPQGLVI